MVSHRFQIHLSTALILLLETGFLMWLSVPASSVKMWSATPRFADDTVLRQTWGWPIRVIVTETPAGKPEPIEYVSGRTDAPTIGNEMLGLFTNLVIYLLILSLTAANLQPNIQFFSWVKNHALSIAIVASATCVAAISEHSIGDICVGELLLAVTIVVYETTLYLRITGPILFSILLFCLPLSN